MNTENNKLIAEFMGGILVYPNTTNYGVFKFSKEDKQKLTYDIEPSTENGISVQYLRFHSNWDLLMKVVEKIESMNYYVDIMNKAVSINNDEDMIVDLSGKDFNTKIEAVYTAVLEFIKWYNQTQNTNL